MIEQSLTLTDNGIVQLKEDCILSLENKKKTLLFGFAGNYGIYKLHVEAAGEWAGMQIRAIWHPHGSSSTSTLVENNEVAVPALVTNQAGLGRLVFEGSDGDKTIVSEDVWFRVGNSAGTLDASTPQPSTTAWRALINVLNGGTDEGIASITPEQHGAVGDGVTDDAAALQAAIDEASAQNSPLRLTPGMNYRFTNGLTLKSNLHIVGNGATLTCDQNGGNSMSGWGTADVHLQNIVLENFSLVAADTDTSGYMLVLARTTGVTLRNLTFSSDICDCNRCCLDLFGANQDITVEGCTFHQLSACAEGGIWVRNWSNNADRESEQSRNIRFLNCTFYKAGGDEVLAVWGWSGNVKDVLISGCSFYEVDDQKYLDRGYWPFWFITLGQTAKNDKGLGITDVRMENCVIRVKRCETIFRMLRSGTHAVVDNCDIYMDQPDDIPEHNPNRSACPMLAQGNAQPDGSTLVQNCRVHLRGDRGRKICYQLSVLRNNYFDVELGNGPAATPEVVGNVFQGTFARQLFNDCRIIRDNRIEATVATPGLFAGGETVEGNYYDLTVTNSAQGDDIFKNNWGSGTIRNNRIWMKCTAEEPFTLKKYNFPARNGGPEYIENNTVSITGNVEFDNPHLPSVLNGIVYRRNNYFNGIPELLHECTGVSFAEPVVTEEYKKYRTLDLQITPEDCTDPIIYSWNDPDGALNIGEDGNYRPIKDGTATVTVTCGMYSATKTMTVALVPVPCESIRLSQPKAVRGSGNVTYLKAFVTPYWTTDDVVWSSENEAIATVTQEGEVSLLQIGVTNIVVTCGSQSSKCEMTVVDPADLPVYKEGAWELDGAVAYVKLPDLAREHTVYMAFDVDVGCVAASQEVPLVTTLVSGQTGQEAICVAFGSNSSGYRTVRWYTTDVETDEDGNTTLYQVPYTNNGFRGATGTASTSFLYLKDGVANMDGTIVWASETATVQAAPDSGVLCLNVQPNDADDPVSSYTDSASLAAALAAGKVHATKATGFKLRSLIVFANSAYTTGSEVAKYREGAEIDLRFDENGNPVNAGTSGDFIIAK